ncbi:glycosyltransferase [Robertmurraya sp. FSL R5-0851]|uniref:glycosyltransferase n=1 Tax=Robertmurraya sp. FSL R5-0851 TaxID=2921584 RepID=UPI0030F91588
MKRNILFVINNLNCGGAEKALISVLQTINYEQFNVDLYLFQKEGLFYSNVPKEVKILQEPKDFKYFDMPIKKALLYTIRKGKMKTTISRIQAGIIFKVEKNPARCEQRVWRYLSNSIPSLEKTYDVAIGYLEKNPIYFCVDKVKAMKKIGFIHTDYDRMKMDPKIDRGYFEKLDHIVTVSEECARILKKKFARYSSKVQVMHNIISEKTINKMAEERIELSSTPNTFVSVGRLNQLKGFDIAIEACKLLVEEGYSFKWYVIGEGEERTNLERLIKELGVENYFILLGLKENPYPYIRAADIYIHPSRFEGKSIALDEAKILKKPIVTTDFSTVKDQITNKTNGLIVDMNALAMFEGIKFLLNNYEMKLRFQDNLSNEELGSETEIEKLYSMFEA